ncbi:hypothetical protein ES707_08569 [subsurface metagenome]
MKPIELLCLVLVLMFAAVGCENKLNNLHEVTKPSEPTKSLHEADGDGDIEQVKLLISKGADVNAQDEKENAPLRYAVKSGTKHGAESKLVKPPEPALHDVEATNISAPASCMQGDIVPITVTVRNQGNRSESVAVKLMSLSDGMGIGNRTITVGDFKETFDVTLTDEIDLTTIGVESVTLSAAGEGMDNVVDLTFDGESQGICHFGNWLAEGDVNGDGIKDLLVSANRWPDETYQGRVYLYYGGANMDATADKTFTGENAFDRFGDNSGFIADLNNDNFGDVIISAPDYNGEGPEFNGDGRVYIYYGGTDMNDTVADLILDPPVGGGGFFGYRITAGDLNNDGWLDLVVPAVIWNNYTGRVYLYYGPIAADATVDKTFTGEGPGNVFGAYPNVGDIDNDNYDDLLLTNRYYPDLKSDTRGRGYLYWGASGTSMSETPALIFDPPGGGTQEFGASNDVKDIDNDNFADVIIGARHWNSYDGRAYLYWGKSRASFTATPDMTFTADGNAQLGGSVRIAHVDGDQYRDIVLGGWNYNSQQGRFYLYYGSTQGGMDVVCDNTFDGPETDFDAFQHIVADFNNDGYGDLAIGGTGYNNEAGRVLLWYGAPGDSTQVTFNWDTSGAFAGKHTLKVEIPPVPGEQNTEDNIKTVTINIQAREERHE